LSFFDCFFAKKSQSYKRVAAIHLGSFVPFASACLAAVWDGPRCAELQAEQVLPLGSAVRGREQTTPVVSGASKA